VFAQKESALLPGIRLVEAEQTMQV